MRFWTNHVCPKLSQYAGFWRGWRKSFNRSISSAAPPFSAHTQLALQG